MNDRDRDFAAQLDEYQAVLAFVTIYDRLTARLDRQITLIARLLEDRDVTDARIADLTDRCDHYDRLFASLEDRLTTVEHRQRQSAEVVGCD